MLCYQVPSIRSGGSLSFRHHAALQRESEGGLIAPTSEITPATAQTLSEKQKTSRSLASLLAHFARRAYHFASVILGAATTFQVALAVWSDTTEPTSPSFGNRTAATGSGRGLWLKERLVKALRRRVSRWKIQAVRRGAEFVRFLPPSRALCLRHESSCYLSIRALHSLGRQSPKVPAQIMRGLWPGAFPCPTRRPPRRNMPAARSCICVRRIELATCVLACLTSLRCLTWADTVGPSKTSLMRIPTWS